MHRNPSVLGSSWYLVASGTSPCTDHAPLSPRCVQGHCNAIACLAATEDRSTIITADVGNESMLVLWSSKNGNPIKSIPRAHAHGIVALDISPGGDWLATISAVDPSTGEQEVGGRADLMRSAWCSTVCVKRLGLLRMRLSESQNDELHCECQPKPVRLLFPCRSRCGPWPRCWARCHRGPRC